MEEIENREIVSVIIPTFNRSEIIQPTIRSIQTQTYKLWECIVVDDHSTDNTKEVIEMFSQEDPRIKYIQNHLSKGAPGARNTGLLESKGEFIVFFDSDNIMHPEFLERVLAAILHDRVDVGNSFSAVINSDDGRKIGVFNRGGNGYIHKGVMTGKYYFDNSSTVIRRQKLFDIGLLDEACPSFQEWDTHIRLSRIASYTTVEEELVDYFRGGKDTISICPERAIKGRLYILNKYRKEYMLKMPVAYLKYCLDVYHRINRLDGDNSIRKSAKAQYRQTVGCLYRCVVQAAYPVWRMKVANS